MEEMEVMKERLSKLELTISNTLTDINGKIDLIRQDLKLKDEQRSTEIAYLRGKISDNEKALTVIRHDLSKLNTENEKLKTSISTVKAMGSVVAFMISLLSFILKYLV